MAEMLWKWELAEPCVCVRYGQRIRERRQDGRRKSEGDRCQ